MKTIENGDFEVVCRDCSIAALCDKDNALKDVRTKPSKLMHAMSRQVLAECQGMPLSTLCPDPRQAITEHDAERVLREKGVVIDVADNRTARQVALSMIVRQRGA